MTTLGNINVKITEERIWRVARWLLVMAQAAVVWAATQVPDLVHDLRSIRPLRADVNALQVRLVEHKTSIDGFNKSLEARALLDDFLFERLASYEAADSERDPKLKAVAAGRAVDRYRDARERHFTPREALLYARAR